jgi:argininosuccinate synthase
LTTHRIVFGYCGDADSLDALASLARTPATEVVAVAVDLGYGPPLGALRDRALAAGAIRCHALDVREEFARDHLLPALARRESFDNPADALARLARPVIEAKIAGIARVEQATVSPACVRHVAPPSRPVYAFEHSAYVEIRFEGGVPAAINGVSMTVTEAIESIETIAHASAIAVLERAYAELGGASDGVIVFRVCRGAFTVAVPAAVP